MIDHKSSVRVAAVVTALGVACGAFGAHALKPLLHPTMLAVYEKAVLYHLVHGVALVLVAILGSIGDISQDTCSLVFRGMLLGILFFCGSLYLLAITGVTWIGAVTPIGGLLFIGSWLLLALHRK